MSAPTLALTPPDTNSPNGELLFAARALGASGGGAGAARVMGLLYDPEVEIDAVLDCLRTEPGLSARVLKVANAPYYGHAGHIGTVDRAVQLLGLTAIRGVAASGCLDRLMPPRGGKGFDPGRFRLHSLAVACVARQISAACGAGIDGEAYMAGLLHDIGVLLLVKAHPAAMENHVPLDSTDRATVEAAEAAHFGATHEYCAQLLIRAWAMPDWLAQAIALHHASAADPIPTATGPTALPAVLALADHLAERGGFGLTPRQGVAAQPALAASLGVGDEQLQAWIDGLPQAISTAQGGG